METEIRAYAVAKGIRPETLERWLSWRTEDGSALERVALSLKISENHLRDLMVWLEEIALRDGLAIHTILASKSIHSIETDPRLGRADKLKRIKEEIRRLRFPRLAGVEDAIQSKIRVLKLHPEIRLSIPPGLEGGTLRVEFCAASQHDVKRLAGRLQEAAEQVAMVEIFNLLGGDLTQ
ncbi:MAG: hypothetical protein ACREP5_08310 [Candidatus Binatia bacterium]